MRSFHGSRPGFSASGLSVGSVGSYGVLVIKYLNGVLFVSMYLILNYFSFLYVFFWAVLFFLFRFSSFYFSEASF